MTVLCFAKAIVELLDGVSVQRVEFDSTQAGLDVVSDMSSIG